MRANIAEGQPSLWAETALLPTHYWDRWVHLLDGTSAGLVTGLSVQAARTGVALAIAWAGLTLRDPAAWRPHRCVRVPSFLGSPCDQQR
jgi:hypothetical protein